MIPSVPVTKGTTLSWNDTCPCEVTYVGKNRLSGKNLWSCSKCIRAFPQVDGDSVVQTVKRNCPVPGMWK